MQRYLSWLVVLGLVGAVLYLSWIPDPRMTDVRILPAWLARWADRFDTLRTAVPFVLLGIFVGWKIIRRRSSGDAVPIPAGTDKPGPLSTGAVIAVSTPVPDLAGSAGPDFPWKSLGWGLGALILLVLIAEVGQLLVPGRVCDGRDVAWGCLGAVVGMAMGVGMGGRRGKG